MLVLWSPSQPGRPEWGCKSFDLQEFENQKEDLREAFLKIFVLLWDPTHPSCIPINQIYLSRLHWIGSCCTFNQLWKHRISILRQWYTTGHCWPKFIHAKQILIFWTVKNKILCDTLHWFITGTAAKLLAKVYSHFKQN